MKLLFISLFCISFVGYSCSCNPHNVRVNVVMDEELAIEDQWVYFFELAGNNYILQDSLFVKKGEDRFALYGNITGEAFSWLTFEKNGPLQALLYLSPGEKITAYITPETTIHVKTEGAPATEERYELRQYNERMLDRIDSLQRVGVDTKKLEHELYVENPLRYIAKTKSPTNHMSMLTGHLSQYLSTDTMTILIAEMKRKFPNDERIQKYPETVDYPPASAESRRVSDLYLGMRRPNSSASTSSYKVGDTMTEIELNDVSGKPVSLYDIDKKFILVDFWAAWCAPCRKEVPYLKSAIERYGNDFEVFAVSIDNDEESWRKAIREDMSEMFTHVFLGNYKETSEALLKQLGITAIPANFLIDKDHNIIATDLRGEELAKKLSELTNH